MGFIDSETTSSSECVSAVLYENGRSKNTEEFVLLEAPLQIKINHQPYSITMRMPGNDFELAVGILLTEGLIENISDALSWEEEKNLEVSDYPISINFVIPKEKLRGKNLVNRSLVSNASCGVCGKTDLSD